MPLIPAHEQARIGADGRWKPDDRFAIREYGPLIIIGLHAADDTLIEMFEATSWAQALSWMTDPARPRPSNSLLLGDAVRAVTHAMGVKTCSACAARQLALNAISNPFRR